MLHAVVLVVVSGVVVLESASVMKLRPPRSFKQLPPIAQETLVAEGCGIPESGGTHLPSSNVIQGQFAASGQTDWAVLCTRRGWTSIRVFWGGPASCPVELAKRPSDRSINRDGWDGPFFDRSISSASPEYILEAGRRYALIMGDKLPVKVTHDGIEDGSEKGSGILFCDNGRWLQLPGAD
jgi:hypothetical protein